LSTRPHETSEPDRLFAGFLPHLSIHVEQEIPAPYRTFVASNTATDGLARPLTCSCSTSESEAESQPCPHLVASRDPQFKGGNRMESSAARQQPTAGDRMISAEQTYLRSELEKRRERLHAALHLPVPDPSLQQL